MADKHRVIFPGSHCWFNWNMKSSVCLQTTILYDFPIILWPYNQLHILLFYLEYGKTGNLLEVYLSGNHRKNGLVPPGSYNKWPWQAPCLLFKKILLESHLVGVHTYIKGTIKSSFMFTSRILRYQIVSWKKW